ncbi:hypothetical protein [Legionella gresilensis]|uniref:hypothetical protein n=1 Tax=Legionella gresilensis TaxID=91823 RepID=UPI001041A934|nr:hypothetical protein [Legionella gresilensis]
MTNSSKSKWNNISDNDIELFNLINDITLSNNCPYFLIGAKARDILLEFYGRNTALRATLDTDIAICCKSLEEFETIKSVFLNNTDFIADDKRIHRILSNQYGYLDILPFGDIQGGKHNIKWPPEYDIELSLIGFKDAYNCAIDIKLNDMIIKIASPLGFALLKLLAWISRKEEKDASDFAYIIADYFEFGNQNRLTEEHQDLLEKDFDYTLSGCRLLGRDLRELTLETQNQLQEFFADKTLIDNLALGISKRQFSYKEALSIIKMIEKGLND